MNFPLRHDTNDGALSQELRSAPSRRQLRLLRRYGFAIFAAAAVGGGCGNPGAQSTPRCVPGQQDACPCGASEGVQTCTPAGIFGACECGGVGGAGGGTIATTTTGSLTSTSASSVGGGNTGGGGSSSSSAGSAGAGGACTTTHYDAQPAPLALHILVERSGGIATNWSSVVTGIKDFIQSQQDSVGAGLQYFPIYNPATGSCQSCADCTCMIACGCPAGACACNNGVCGCLSCDITTYSNAAVDIAPVPASASILNASIDSITPYGVTPTRVALRGTLDYAQTWAKANPSYAVGAVMITRGSFGLTACAPNDLASVQQVAQMYSTGTPAIQTHVIGIGTAAQQELDSIAKAGGTGTAYLANVEIRLNTIRDHVRTCQYALPQVGGTIDFGKVNVQHVPGNGNPTKDLVHVTAAANCDQTTGGWYYNDENAPSRILMCPATCAGMAADGGAPDILYGCPTMIGP
jgi:hypothetical protein